MSSDKTRGHGGGVRVCKKGERERGGGREGEGVKERARPVESGTETLETERK